MKFSNVMKVNQTLNSDMLFGIKITEDFLNNIIMNKDFPCFCFIYYLNKMLNHKIDSDVLYEYKQNFYNNRTMFEGLDINVKNLFDDNTIFSPFSCRNLIERIIKYGKFKNHQLYEYESYIKPLILFYNVLETSVDEISENEEKKDELLYYLSIISYNQFSNDVFNSNYYRLSYIYENYLKRNNEVIKQFEYYYGYSLKTYILFLQIFLLNSTYSDKDKIDLDVLKKSKEGLEIIRCFNDHILNINSQEVKENIIINSYIPSAILLEKPIIWINGKYLVMNSRFLLDRIYGVIFKKIKNSYSNEKYYRQVIYGPLFENYCRDIAKHYVDIAKFEYYTFIDEFSYKYKGSERKSSDFYIVYKDVVLVFEIKSTARFKQTTIDTNVIDKNKFIIDEIDVKIQRPLTQIEDRLNDIKQLNACDYPNIPLNQIKHAKEYYYLVVSDECVLNNKKIYRDYFSKLKPKYSHYRPIYLNISEYECLMMSLLKRNKPIDRLLRHYHTLYYSSNFYEMIDRERKFHKFDRLDIFDPNPFEKELKDIFNVN